MMWGVSFDKYEFRKFPAYLAAVKEAAESYQVDIVGLEDDEIIEKVQDQLGISEIVRYMVKDFKLEYEVPYEWDQIIIGRSWCHVQDNETGAQFKQPIQEDIQKLLGKEVECSTQIGAYQS
jgi:hypothetical protein